MNFSLDQKDKLFTEYFEKINTQLSDRLEIQLNGVLKTDHGDYGIVKIVRFELEEFHFDNEKIHNLFSSNGFKISGTILLKAEAYTPNSDKNGYTTHIFAIGFKPTPMKFNFDEETFSIEENIDISYIIRAGSERMIY